MYNIGEFVTVLTYAHSNGITYLIKAHERNNFDQSLISEHRCQIIGKNKINANELLILCDFDPHSYFSYVVSETWPLNVIVTHDVNKKFIGQKYCYIDPNMIVREPYKSAVLQIHSSNPDGQRCTICSKFASYAEANLPNGGFVCYNCRQTRVYKIYIYLKKHSIDPLTVEWL